MESNKSLDFVINVVIALLNDIHMSHKDVFDSHALKLTCQKVRKRSMKEGMGFFTKAMPRLGKALDRALSSNTPLRSVEYGFDSMNNSNLPRFLGELFSRVFDKDGFVSHQPCVKSVRLLRQVLYCFYKYELPYTTDQEQQVIDRFKRTEDDLLAGQVALRTCKCRTDDSYKTRRGSVKTASPETIAREARILLSRVFSGLDLTDITPRHGPGAVATKQRLWDKYQWSNVSSKIRKHFPLDAYFFASLGHVCDRPDLFQQITDEDLPARVVLVPKDSRGPRLISCEPVDYQWVQQGVMKRIVSRVEHHRLTRDSVRFTDQAPNQFGALAGSLPNWEEILIDHGRVLGTYTVYGSKYATLDLNEASDRVSMDLVRLLFPEHIVNVLEACRSSATVLPDGKVLPLQKFAPMGSALCFPILALTIWAILAAGNGRRGCRNPCIYVYGDDVIVPTAYAGEAMERLELFGLKINRDKSCTTGFFRESCGMDAFRGVNVTPVRFRTVWSSEPSPDVYQSWIAYANALFDRQYLHSYDMIVAELTRVYGEIPEDNQCFNTVPSLRLVPHNKKPRRWRTNRALQRREWLVNTVKAPVIRHEMDGWSMLLRYFTECGVVGDGSISRQMSSQDHLRGEETSPFSVRSYTKRATSMLVKRWR